MEKIYLDAQLRQRTGKEDAKKVRTAGMVPAALYKKGKETFHLLVKDKDLNGVLHTKAGENVILTLRVQEKEGKPKEKTVIIKEIQVHPLKDNIMHVDFGEISLTETLKVKVPLETKGEAVGVKADGGVLERILWELEVECLPTNIPERIEVDVTTLKINDSIHVKDISIPEGVKVLNDPEVIAVSVKPPHIEKVVEEVVEGEVTEPELIREKKEVEGEEGEEGEEKEKEKEKAAPPKQEKGAGGKEDKG